MVRDISFAGRQFFSNFISALKSRKAELKKCISIFPKEILRTRQFSQSNFVGKMNKNNPDKDNSYHHNFLC